MRIACVATHPSGLHLERPRRLDPIVAVEAILEEPKLAEDGVVVHESSGGAAFLGELRAQCVDVASHFGDGSPQCAVMGRSNEACCALSGSAARLRAAANPATVRTRFKFVFIEDLLSALIRGTLAVPHPYTHADENSEPRTLRCASGNCQELIKRMQKY